MQTYIEYKKIGKADEDTYIVLFNGREVGQPCTKAVAGTVTDWLLHAISDLENIL